MPPKVLSSDAAQKVQKTSKTTPGGASKELARKVSDHPPTMVMVKEAVKELDTRKGVSSQAIRNYIKEKYPSIDAVRSKYLVRRALTKGLESGVLVRPANATVVSGVQGRFRLAVKGKSKEPKAKTTENTDPNEAKSPKAAKARVKKALEDATEKPPTVKKKKDKASEDSKPKATKGAEKPKKATKGAAASKVAPAKRPKAKASGDEEEEAAGEPKVPRKTSRVAAKGDKEEAAKGDKEEAPKKVAKAPKKKQDDKGDTTASKKAPGKRKNATTK